MAAANYLLIKQHGLDAKGRNCTARASAQLLLDAKVWPLWDRTRNRKVIAAGDRLAVYLAGTSEVIATAQVLKVEKWSNSHARWYPLLLDGIPAAVLVLENVSMLPVPVQVRQRLQQLSFVPRNSSKWGVAFMGGVRVVSDVDFKQLTCGGLE